METKIGNGSGAGNGKARLQARTEGTARALRAGNEYSPTWRLEEELVQLSFTLCGTYHPKATPSFASVDIRP